MENRISVLVFPEVIRIGYEKKKKHNYIKYFSLNGYDIKIQKGNILAVGINKMLFILFVLFCLFYLTTI